MAVRENWLKIRENVENAARDYAVSSSGIQIMAVSKTRSLDEIREAIDAGIHLFGENRVEEAAEKFAATDQKDARLCLIGHLQSKKVSRIGARFSAVHSVDSLKIAERLSRHRLAIGSRLEVLLQVNTSGETSKSGFQDRMEFRDIAHQIAALKGLEIKGLMTMAPFVDDERIVRACFASCREWAADIKDILGENPVLSMGMSSDYRWAIAEGSNMLRIGTALFAG